jgi:hypothetical protein
MWNLPRRADGSLRWDGQQVVTSDLDSHQVAYGGHRKAVTRRWSQPDVARGVVGKQLGLLNVGAEHGH